MNKPHVTLAWKVQQRGLVSVTVFVMQGMRETALIHVKLFRIAKVEKKSMAVMQMQNVFQKVPGKTTANVTTPMSATAGNVRPSICAPKNMIMVGAQPMPSATSLGLHHANAHAISISAAMASLVSLLTIASPNHAISPMRLENRSLKLVLETAIAPAILVIPEMGQSVHRRTHAPKTIQTIAAEIQFVSTLARVSTYASRKRVMRFLRMALMQFPLMCASQALLKQSNAQRVQCANTRAQVLPHVSARPNTSAAKMAGAVQTATTKNRLMVSTGRLLANAARHVVEALN